MKRYRFITFIIINIMLTVAKAQMKFPGISPLIGEHAYVDVPSPTAASLGRYGDVGVSFTWDRLDPMCESYTYMSPYSYCLDNPVNVVDPDGKEVFILYQDKKGKYKAFFYNGRQRYVPNNQFVLDFVHTYNYLKANNIGTNVRNAVENADILIGVHEMNITQYINESQMPIVLWESRKGIILSNGKRQSPAVRLEHEFDHAIDDWKSAKNHREKRMTYDEQYGNKEERRVIEGSETRTARKLHQGIRKDHHGSTYPVKDPRFTK